METAAELPGGQPRPRHVLLELTRACNLRCVHCAVSSEGYVAGSLPWPTFERILPALRRLRPFVELSGHGESLVYRRFFDAFAAVVEAGCAVSFITNGTLLSPALVDRMLPYAGQDGWCHVTVSIDAAEPVLFERLRRGARFDTIVSNLEALRDAKARLGSAYPALAFNTVLMRDNLGQLPEIVGLAARVGAASVTLTELLEYEHFKGHGPDGTSSAVRNALASARAEAKSRGVRLVLVPGLVERLGEGA